VSFEMRERIDELVEALLARLDTSGVPPGICDDLRDPLRDQLSNERFKQFIVSRMGDPPSRTLEGLVLSYDPRLDLVALAYKN
jgi:hypothetical protein